MLPDRGAGRASEAAPSPTVGSQVNLELLRTFLEVCTSQSFAEAARRRRVTPSAVSQQMKALEHQLGTGLFTRSGRRMVLTSVGEALLDGVRRGVGTLDRAASDAREEQRAMHGVIRIGGPAPFCRMWLRPRLLALLAAHPDLLIEVEFGVPSVLGKKLGDGDLDLAIIVRLADPASFERRPIHTEEFVAVASRGYLAERGRPLTAAALREHRFIAYDRDLPMLAPWWETTFGRREPLPQRIACRIASLDEMLALAEAGVGITVLPTYFVASALERGSVVTLAPKSKRRTNNAIYLAWRRDDWETTRVRTVREALLER